MNKIIAVDFDGTMCVNKWPDIGEANEELLNYLREEKAHGTKLILWTNRSGTHLSDAVDWAKERGIEFDTVNDNLQESVEFFGGNSRKIYATEFIDDRASNRFHLPYLGQTDSKIIHTHNVVSDILEEFENILDKYDITIPSPEDEDREDDNCARLYGSVYSDLMDAVEYILLETCMKVKEGFKVVPYIYGGDMHDQSDCEMAEE